MFSHFGHIMTWEMIVLRHALRLIVLICVAALLIVAVPQIAVALALTFLIPILFFFRTLLHSLDAKLR